MTISFVRHFGNWSWITVVMHEHIAILLPMPNTKSMKKNSTEKAWTKEECGREGKEENKCKMHEIKCNHMLLSCSIEWCGLLHFDASILYSILVMTNNFFPKVLIWCRKESTKLNNGEFDHNLSSFAHFTGHFRYLVIMLRVNFQSWEQFWTVCGIHKRHSVWYEFGSWNKKRITPLYCAHNG